MKTEIKKILYKFLQDGITSDDAAQQVLDLFDVMSSAIAFAEWVDWNKYERFGRRDLWYDKKSSYSNPLLIKTTEDLWNEFVKLGLLGVRLSLPDADNYDYLRGFIDGYGGEEPHDVFPDGFKDINDVWDRMYELGGNED